MLRIFGFIGNIATAVTALLTLLSLLFLVSQTSALPLPHAAVAGLYTLLLPFINAIRQVFGVHTSEFYGHKFEDAYGLVVIMFALLTVVCMQVASILFRWDYQLKKGFSQMAHGLHVWHLGWKKRRQPPTTASGKPYKPEAEAVAAFELENVAKYPPLKGKLDQRLATLAPGQWVFRQENRVMLRFPTTREACTFIVGFAQLFEDTVEAMQVYVEHPPGYRFAVHSLASEKALMENETFIWALLKCVAHNTTYLSLEAKEQLEAPQQTASPATPLQLVHIGTFSRLGNRTFPDVYRLSYEEPNRFKLMD